MYICHQCDYVTDIKSNLSRHLKRKTGCRDKNVNITQENVNITAGITQENVNITRGNVNIDQENVNIDQENVNIDQENVNMSFEVVSDSHVSCTTCQKTLTRASAALHSCRGAPSCVCIHCTKVFACRQSLSVHRKKCKPIIVHNISQTIHHHNTVINNVNIVLPQGFVFSQENVDYLLDRMKSDPVFRDRLSGDFETAFNLVHNNADHPENQTIRKIVKKDPCIYTRRSVDRDEWEARPNHVAIPVITDNLQRKLQLRFTDLTNDRFVREVMYGQLKDGPKYETYLLSEEHSSPVLSIVEYEADRKRLDEIAASERRTFLTQRTTANNPEACRVFRERLHDAFLRRGLMYKVVDGEGDSVLQFFRFLKYPTKAPEFEYYRTLL